MAYCGTQGAQDSREGFADCIGELVFGAAAGIGEGREGDDQGTGGEIGRGRPAIRDGEQDGALDEELERFGLAWLAVDDADTAGEAAEGIGDLRGEGGDVIEGEDPVEAGEGEEFAGGGRKRGDGRRYGIDDGAEDAGGEGFAAAGGATEDEDGIGSAGAKGGEEPGEAAEPIGGAWGAEVEGGSEDVQG
jgi:hypothetical protein